MIRSCNFWHQISFRQFLLPPSEDKHFVFITIVKTPSIESLNPFPYLHTTSPFLSKRLDCLRSTPITCLKNNVYSITSADGLSSLHAHTVWNIASIDLLLN